MISGEYILPHESNLCRYQVGRKIMEMRLGRSEMTFDLSVGLVDKTDFVFLGVMSGRKNIVCFL